jgi:outer membrane biogenesis lipoprotein LolB
MRKTPEFVLMGLLALASLLVQACATQSGSSGGDEQMARAERIDEQTINHISTRVRCADLTDKAVSASGIGCS